MVLGAKRLRRFFGEVERDFQDELLEDDDHPHRWVDVLKRKAREMSEDAKYEPAFEEDVSPSEVYERKALDLLRDGKMGETPSATDLATAQVWATLSVAAATRELGDL